MSQRSAMLDVAPSISAGAEASVMPEDTDAMRLARAIHEAIAAGHDALTMEEIQALFAALCKAYAIQIENGSEALPVSRDIPITPTEAVAVANGLLRAADVAIFELAMWQSWSGR